MPSWYPAVRRENVHRQRHGLLLHLGRFRALPPPGQTTAGLWSGWANSLFEDNAEYGYGMLPCAGHQKPLIEKVKALVVESVWQRIAFGGIANAWEGPGHRRSNGI